MKGKKQADTEELKEGPEEVLKTEALLNILEDLEEEKKKAEESKEELKKSEKIFRDLYETSMTLTGTTDKILAAICKKVHEVFGGFYVTVYYSKDKKLMAVAGYNLPPQVKLGKKAAQGSLCLHTLESKKALFSNNLKKDKCPVCGMPYAKDKHIRSYSLNTYFGAPLVFSDGSIQGALCIVYKEKKDPFPERDIKTLSLFGRRIAIELERRKAEGMVRESEEKYKALVENAIDFIYMIDRKYKVLSLNKSAAGLFRKKPKEVIGKSIFDLFPKEISTGYSKELRNIFRTGKSHISESRMVVGGKEFFINTSLSPVRDYKGKVAAVLGVTRDITEYKKAEEARMESEEKYKAIFETAANLIVSVNRKGLIVDCNKRVKGVLGYKRDEIIGQKMAKIIHKDDLPKAQKSLNIILTKGCLYNQEYRMARKDGRLIDVKINSSALTDEKGRFMRTICIIDDVTERKKEEEEIKMLLKLNQDIIEKSPFGIYTVNSRGMIDYANPAMCRISGITRKKLEGINTLTLPNYKKIGLSKKISKGLKGKPFFMGPVDYISYYGEKRTVRNFIGIPIGGKKDKVLLVIVEDMTKRKEAEERLRKSEKFVRDIIEHAGISVIAYSREGRLLIANREFLGMTGYTKKEIGTRKKLFKLAFPSRLVSGRVNEAFSMLRRGKNIANFVVPLLCKDGSTTIVVANITAMDGGKGNITGEAIFIRDLSEIFELEEQIRYWAANGFVQVRETAKSGIEISMPKRKAGAKEHKKNRKNTKR